MQNRWDDTTDLAARPKYDQNSLTKPFLMIIAGPNLGELHDLQFEVTVLGRRTDSNIRLGDEGASRHHCRLRKQGSRIILEDMSSSNGTFCNGQRVSSIELKDGDRIQLGTSTIIKFSFHDKIEEQFQKHMLEAALRDGLTGAYNKKYFMERLDSEMKYAARHNIRLSLMILDLDHFKKVNDSFGHLAGDKVLVKFSELMHQSIRIEDVFARYGGEEFAIICRSISKKDVYFFANRLREQTAALHVMSGGKNIPVTVSIGLASLPDIPAKNPEQLIRVADKMLYYAKEKGRNRVICAKGRDESKA